MVDIEIPTNMDVSIRMVREDGVNLIGYSVKQDDSVILRPIEGENKRCAAHESDPETHVRKFRVLIYTYSTAWESIFDKDSKAMPMTVKVVFFGDDWQIAR